MGLLSPVAVTRLWYEAMDCARTSSRRISGAERYGGTRDPDVEGTICALPPLRDAAARQSGNRRLDQVLRPLALASSTEYESTR